MYTSSTKGFTSYIRRTFPKQRYIVNGLLFVRADMTESILLKTFERGDWLDTGRY